MATAPACVSKTARFSGRCVRFAVSRSARIPAKGISVRPIFDEPFFHDVALRNVVPYGIDESVQEEKVQNAAR